MGDTRIWIGMSGGVDSSLAAALLAEQGLDCLGVTMVLGRGATDAAAAADAASVCEHLGIPHTTIDLSAEFKADVIDATATAYSLGQTPNPCVLCNASVKFGSLLDRARDAGALLATGHYARIVQTPEGAALARPADVSKDQTYFLYRLSSGDLLHVVFPLGEFTKTQVRAMASERGFAGKHGKESQDACFLGKGGYPELVARSHPEACVAGPIVDETGTVLGTHTGICRYTVGQRRGIGVASAEPLYVLRIDAAHNSVVVGPQQRLAVSRITASGVIWNHSEDSMRAGVMVRYNAGAIAATVVREGARLIAETDEPVLGVAPGQSIVCYNGDIVIGGGIIEEAS
ncbi:MAG: tRNA 2-thiouridine(34) synthase MnmA [Actinobacteria bacterium HGW-Actinobacteria-6]|jgi:tRNA-specific 2-thiouridylase|nr:MAG: tRNA 2-thiouridine(34) synthase MnmA [Actinobacteria bacterium HGW-Actinobacteria-6]